ncbi:unnamed protein product [Colias eurytheme]|nr:unnamed protein product [Colias eurytheme]
MESEGFLHDEGTNPRDWVPSQSLPADYGGPGRSAEGSGEPARCSSGDSNMTGLLQAAKRAVLIIDDRPAKRPCRPELPTTTPKGKGVGKKMSIIGYVLSSVHIPLNRKSGFSKSFVSIHRQKIAALHERRRRELPPARTLPEGYVECGGSGNSTPRTPTLKRPANNDSTGDGEEAPASRRCLIPPASSSSSAVRARPLRDEDISQILNNYGSEEDDDSDDEDLVVPVQMPRRVDRLFTYEEETEVPPINADIRFEWPPQPSSSLQPQPSAQPEPEPNAEPEPSADLGAIAEPHNKFDFRWRGFQESQIPPELRKEPFSEINCWPTVPLTSPYDAFTAIWDRQIMEHIAVETNRYAQQKVTAMIHHGLPKSRITRWRDTDPDELYVYFAIVLATGIVVKSRIDSYWSTAQAINIFSWV